MLWFLFQTTNLLTNYHHTYHHLSLMILLHHRTSVISIKFAERSAFGQNQNNQLTFVMILWRSVLRQNYQTQMIIRHPECGREATNAGWGHPEWDHEAANAGQGHPEWGHEVSNAGIAVVVLIQKSWIDLALDLLLSGKLISSKQMN